MSGTRIRKSFLNLREPFANIMKRGKKKPHTPESCGLAWYLLRGRKGKGV